MQKTYLKRLKEEILKNNQLSTRFPKSTSIRSTSFTCNSTVSVFRTGNSTTRSSDVYFYDIGVVPVLTIGACVFFACNKDLLKPQSKNKSTKNSSNLQNYKNGVVWFRFNDMTSKKHIHK